MREEKKFKYYDIKVVILLVYFRGQTSEEQSSAQ